MAKVSLRHIYKVYDGNVKAVNDFNLEIADKEFIVFVGPSGCGKSTTLRMVAGLEDITAGELWIGDTLCNHIEAKNRNISMVFQNYALFPNMTVYENIAFGLRMHRVPKAEIEKKVAEAAEILGITEYLDRKPKALSGGQRQRVALGRAIVREPNVFLFDEPLSNLDAKLRSKMRTEITKLHKRLNTTFIYVTHDQVEAMTMGDRIVIMKDGFVQQIDTPHNLFRHPINKFVAGFIGTPQMNFFEVTLKREDNGCVTVRADSFTLVIPEKDAYRLDEAYLDGQRKVIMGIRPDDISPVASELPGLTFKAYVSVTEKLGSETLVYANTNADELMKEISETAFCSSAGEDVEIRSTDAVDFAVDTAKLYFFDAESEQTIKHRVPDNAAKASVKEGKLSLFGQSAPLVPALMKALSDGDYFVKIPSGAIKLDGKGFTGEIASVEKLGEDYLYRIVAGGASLFATDKKLLSVGESVTFSVSYDMVDFSGAVTVPAIDRQIRFTGRFVKEKHGREAKHFIQSDAKKIETPFAFNQKLYDCGRSIFKKALAFEIDTADISLASQGIPVQVLDVLDYGENKFALVGWDDLTFAVSVDADFDSESTNIAFNFEKIRVYGDALNMRLF